MKTILVFEPLSGGHRGNFIRWLREAASEFSGCRFVFFTAEEAGDLQPERLGWWRKQKQLYGLFRRACELHRPDHVLILELTHLELPLILFGSPVPLSAILFVQYPELSNGWKKIFKHWKTRLLPARAPLRNLFLLNGQKSCEFLRKHFSARFIPIADPAPAVDAEPGFSLREHFGIEAGRKVFLFFGAISKRKGADGLIRVLRQLHTDRSAVVFCGVPEADYEAEFTAAVREIRSVEVYFENQFVSDERMTAMFEQADLILMPYARSEYSSGILAVAAKAGTPVLGPPGGLLGRLIRENGLGLAAELTPAILEQPVMLDAERCRRFVERNTIRNFSRPILEAVCNEG